MTKPKMERDFYFTDNYLYNVDCLSLCWWKTTYFHKLSKSVNEKPFATSFLLTFCGLCLDSSCTNIQISCSHILTLFNGGWFSMNLRQCDHAGTVTVPLQDPRLIEMLASSSI